MKKLLAIALCLVAPVAHGQELSDPTLVGELMAFHGTKAIVSAMTTHCYETTGLDPAYKDANANWYLRNIGFLDLADRVVVALGGEEGNGKQNAETYGGTQIMTAYNQAADKEVFCRGFLASVDSGALDLDKQLPDVLKRAQAIAAK